MSGVAFACHWNRPAQTTWSGTPWNLRQALAQNVALVDAPVSLSVWQTRALQILGTRYSHGAVTSRSWKHARLSRRVVERQALAAVARSRADCVIEIGDLAAFDQPFGVVQDLSFNLLLKNFGGHGVLHFPGLSERRVEQLHERQRDIYDRAAWLFPMSCWLADDMVSDGVNLRKITVIRPGIWPVQVARESLEQRVQGPRNRLLFVGRDFDTKAGFQVVAAFQELRQSEFPQAALTIIGPSTWPLEGQVPQGISFLGPLPHDAVLAEMQRHDILVMPSFFEGFGIVFLEALSRGMPCIGRNVCAMPEIIRDGWNGFLIDAEDLNASSLAQVIAGCLSSDAVFQHCTSEAPKISDEYSWWNVARRMTQVVTS